MSETPTSSPVAAVAIIGMAGRWPRAGSVGEFWRNIRDGVECISRFSIAELEVHNAAALASQPDYVKARSVVDGADQFDASFFGILPKEAELMDPQQRVFLECCWEALEDAGYEPQTYAGAIGVFAGCSTNTYFLRNLCVDRDFIHDYVGSYPLCSYPTMLGALADSLSTRVSYRLNLRGPSCTIQSACSTSLVAICQACQSLLTYQSDMALAGGVSITFPQKRGYRYQEGGMGSSDGYCRPFDANAQGTVFGSGAGVILLKRLEDALADGDNICAVIRGFAVNNDGSGKVGYTAPSVDGQASVIAMAHAVADIDPESITYLEAHGTATPLGDPIEFTALTRAFRAGTEASGFCALGSVKANVGHLEAAAGVTGLINAVQALVHKQLPPACGFGAPNPNIDFANSPFYINKHLSDWHNGTFPRRAGVSSFGVGGTNAHVVLEETPPGIRQNHQPADQLLVLSARSAEALEEATNRLTAHLKTHPDEDLSSVAYTLQIGRRAFEHRRAVVCTDLPDAIRALESRDRQRVFTQSGQSGGASVIFMFPGQGSQYAEMGRGLCRSDAKFRADIETCADLLKPHLNYDLRAVLCPSAQSVATEIPELRETWLAQPALFAIEYALARLWMRWGVEPKGMIGHSVGEYVAACLAGVFSLDDALTIVAARARMIQQLPPGVMLSVRLDEGDLLPLLNGELSLAAVNSPKSSVVSGPEEAIDAFERTLSERKVATRRLVTSHAFHSRMMDPIIGPFTDYVRRFRLSAPRLPYISGVTGSWITADQATDPDYWARHIRQPVHFSKGLRELLTAREVLLEVGPGQVLCKLARLHCEGAAAPVAVPSLPDTAGEPTDSLTLLNAAGCLWLHGVKLNWAEMHGAGMRRCSLPTYPFERKSYWIEPSAEDVTPQDRISHPCAPPAESGDTTSSEPMPNHQTEPDAAFVPARTDRIRAAIIEIFQDLSGLSISEFDGSVTFLEMGFDSLFLTQVTLALQSTFGLKITMRQLLEDVSTLASLAAHLDARLPADAFPAASAPKKVDDPVAQAETTRNQIALEATSAATPGPNAMALAPTPASTNGQTPIEAVVREQLQVMLQLMAKQLEAIRGTESPAGARPATAPPAVPSTLRIPPASPVSPASSVPLAPGVAKAEGAQDFKPFGPYKPVERGTIGGLSEPQRRHLDDLIRRYTGRTIRSRELTQRHRRVLADPRVASGFRSQWKDMVYPIVTVRSSGSRLWDVDGNEYIDILNGFGPIFFGHSPPFVTEAIAAQLANGYEIGPQTVLAGEVAELVCELTGNERATFCNTGSEAVMAAIRVARTVTGRQKIVLFAGAYHGTFDEVLVKGIRKGGAPHSLPIAPGIPREKVANVVVLDYGTAESLEYIRQHAGELAAVLVEPVMSRHPELRPIEFLREVRKITEKSETALIFDEIVTGFRTHPGGVQALFGIRADLATYGKVAGGGMPIGILAGRAKFMDALDGGMWQYGDESFPETGVTFFAGTFVRHPLALVSSLAVLKRIKEAGPELQQSLNDKTTRLVQALNACFEKEGVPTRIQHFASWFYFSMPSDQPFAGLLYYHLREKGIYIQEGFPCFVTTAHSEADIDQVIVAFQESVAQMQAGGFLPAPVHGDPAPTVVRQGEAPSPNAEVPKEGPLTESQMEIWLSARLSDEASCAFNESLILTMQGSLNAPALRQSLESLVLRHDSLRSTFDPNRNCVRVLDSIPIDMPVVDLSSLLPAERAANLEQMIRADASRPFDLAAGPLVRLTLMKLEPDLHALLFSTHHIVCDGWSTNVLLQELGQLYAARCAGTDGKLAAAMPFRTYALTQAEWRKSREHGEVESWWAGKFAVPVTPLELPTDRPRASVKSFRGGTVHRTLGTDSYQRIKRFGAQRGCTLFATLLFGFKTLVHRLTGQNDIVVGIPAAGHSLVEAESLVGHCVNFLPLRTSFEGDPEAAALLGQVRGALLDAYEHQNYTYGSLVKKLGLVRDPSRLPLVEVQFNLERVGSKLTFPGLTVQVEPCSKCFVNFDLFLNVVESEDRLDLYCDFNRDLFDATTVERWLQHLETLFEGLIGNPHQAVSTLPLLDDSERRRLIVDWNDTRVDYPRDKCVHQLIAEQAARSPQAIAAVCGDRRLTFGQLDASANRLARFLQKRGVGAGDLVAICLDRSLDLLVGVLGILKAGAAYVPLDPEYPRERISTTVEDASPALLLTQKDIAGRLNLTARQTVCLDSVWSEVNAEDDGPPANQATPLDLAYVIYTSGSTGKPKGVQIPHRAWVNLLCSMAHRPGLSSEDTLLAVTSLAFDISMLELFLPLCVGARLVIATRETAGDGNLLLALLAESASTALQATPTTWRLLIEAGWNGPSNLKILCGGEAMPRDLADALLARSSSVWNMYGPTETTIWSATSLVNEGPEPVTIGPPIANTEFYVLDAKGQPAPIGVPGELYIGGEGVAAGYWNRPDLTAEKFIPDPFRGEEGCRLYKTGDIVRSRPDGTFDFLGRLDTQVKVRGFRIETAEVEFVLKQFDDVRDCVVVAREASPGDQRLVAYVVAKPSVASADLRRFVAAKLPPYMVPSMFVPLEALPQTPNGKIDRRALPAPNVLRTVRDQDRVVPRNRLEQTFADVCAQVLQLQSFGIHDSLFELGADSLQVFQIVARANAAGLDVTPPQILSGRTVAAICEELDRARPTAQPAPELQLAAVDRDRYRMNRSQINAAGQGAAEQP